MNKEVAKAHSDTLKEWSEQYKRDGGVQCEEMSFLLARASRLAAGMASGTFVSLDPISAPDEPVDEPREG